MASAVHWSHCTWDEMHSELRSRSPNPEVLSGALGVGGKFLLGRTPDGTCLLSPSSFGRPGGGSPSAAGATNPSDWPQWVHRCGFVSPAHHPLRAAPSLNRRPWARAIIRAGDCFMT